MHSPGLRLLFFSATILLLFCVSWLLSKDVTGYMPALHVAGLRMAVTAVALWIAAACVAHKQVGLSSPEYSKTIWLHFFLLSVFGFSLYFGSSFMALHSLAASELTVVLALIPGITYILGWLLHSVRFSRAKSAGVLLVTAAAVAFNGGNQGGGIHLGGLALALVAAASYAIYGLLSRRWLADLPLLPSLARIVTLAAISFVPLFILDWAPLAALSGDAALKIGIMGVFCSAPVYILYQKIIAQGGVVYANSIGVLAPFFLYLMELLLVREMRFDMIKILSLMIVILGAFLLFSDAAQKNALLPEIAKKAKGT